jgi:DNA-directed RNA polymerase specialized sigma24 family protein
VLTGLYERHYNEILSFSMSLTKNLQAAEDITQEAFMRMLANSDNPAGPFSASMPLLVI